MKKGRYNFISQANLPKGPYLGQELSLPSDIKWAQTSDFNDIAKNHCGAVFITNLALYYKNIGYDKVLTNNLSDTFSAVHTIVGNGPKMLIAKNSKTYFLQKGYKLKYKTFRSFKKVKTSLAKGQPLAVLLTTGILDWHWVMAVGWREYSCGERYLRVITGWDFTSNKFYRINKSAYLWSITKYWIDL
ncbi:MAG: hypothetical protein GX769_03590 [Erysipelothrix sp.]|nr:hypothetical protein [Erysipelothrix sp.]